MKKSALVPENPKRRSAPPALKKEKEPNFQTFNDLDWNIFDEIDFDTKQLEEASWTACTGGCGHSK